MVSSRSTALGMSWAARPQLWVLRAFSLILFILVAVISWPLWRDALEMNVLWASVHHAMAPSAYFVAPLASFEMLSTAMLTIVILVTWLGVRTSFRLRPRVQLPQEMADGISAAHEGQHSILARAYCTVLAIAVRVLRGWTARRRSEVGRFVGGPAPRVRRMQRIIPAGAPVRLSLRASLADAGCRLPPSTHHRRPG